MIDWNEMNIHPEYGFDDEYDEIYEDEYSNSSLMRRCIEGTIHSLQYNLFITISFAFLQIFITSLNFISYTYRHILIALSGCYLLSLWDIPSTVSKAIIATVILIVISLILPIKKYLGWIITTSIFISLIILEMKLPPETYTYRGILMILSMKVSSLSFDLSERKYSVTVPEMFGYLLSPSTLLFGPALPFSSYRTAFIPQSIKSHIVSSLTGLFYVLFCLLCLMVSTCISPLILPDNGIGRDYGDAQSFRFSHYFICFWAQALVSISGEDSPLIVDLIEIELPRSLTQIVSLWNVPMHHYLYHYVYVRLRSFGTFFAVLITFTVSSLFHGLNGQLSLVLLSLAFVSYTERRLRSSLSSLLSSCIKSRRCHSKCSHIHSSSSILSISINLLFSILSIYHLIYLGMPWNGESMSYPISHTVNTWKEHYFLSHIISISYLLISFLLEL